MGAHYPEAVSNAEAIGNHHAFALDLPFGEESFQPQVRIPRLRNISDEGRGGKSAVVAERVASQKESSQEEVRLYDVARAYGLIQKLIHAALEGHYARYGRKKLPILTPLGLSYRRHSFWTGAISRTHC